MEGGFIDVFPQFRFQSHRSLSSELCDMFRCGIIRTQMSEKCFIITANIVYIYAIRLVQSMEGIAHYYPTRAQKWEIKTRGRRKSVR